MHLRSEPTEIRQARGHILLGAFEGDLRKLIEKQICPNFFRSLSFLGSIESQTTAFHRLSSDFPDAKIDDPNIEIQILEYLDTLQLVEVALRNKAHINSQIFKHIQVNNKAFQDIFRPIRNKIAHSRSIDEEEFSAFYELCTKLSRESEIWIQLKKWSEEVLDLSAHELRENKGGRISNKIHKKIFHDLLFHNLPEEDYQNWSFTGRKNFLEKVNLELFSNNRNLVQLHGQGGIGKTAIARKICEEQLARDNVNFIWWHSSKIRSFSYGKEKGIQALNKAPLLSDIEKEILEVGFSLDELKRESSYKPLFVLDNMESQKDLKEVIDICNRLSSIGKVIVTGRNEIPEMDGIPISISGFNDTDSQNFLNRVAKFYSQNAILQAEDSKKKQWAKKLGNIPLLMRDFVEDTVKSGKSPVEYFQDSEHHDDIQAFMFFNVTDNFSDDAKTLISILEIDESAMSSTLLREITGWKDDRLHEALNQIRRSALVESLNISEFTHYKLSNRAREYVEKNLAFINIKKNLEKGKLLENISHREEFKSRNPISNIDDYSYFETTTENDLLAGYELSKTLLEINSKSLDEKIKQLLDLENKWFSFSPLQLNLALLFAEKGNSSEAVRYFEIAWESNTEELNKEKIVYQYIKYLIQQNDLKGAQSLFPEIASNKSILGKLMGAEINLDTSLPETFDQLYLLFNQARLVTDKRSLTREILRIVLFHARKLKARDNFSDAKWYLDDFMKRLQGNFVYDYFDDQNVYVFLDQFIELYLEIQELYLESGIISFENLGDFLSYKDFNYNHYHLESFINLREKNSKIIMDKFFTELGLDDDINFQILLTQREIEYSKRGKISALFQTKEGQKMGEIEDINGKLIVFFSSTVSGSEEEYDQLQLDDEVSWAKLEVDNLGRKDVAYDVKKLSIS